MLLVVLLTAGAAPLVVATASARVSPAPIVTVSSQALSVRSDAPTSADPVREGGDFAVVPGAPPQPGAKTIPTWHDVFTDPTNGLTYGVDLVGSQDPRSAGAGTTSVPVAIIPVDLSFEASGG
jgi:hypothetical protein